MKIRTGDRQLIKELNISIVIDTIRRHEPVSRVEIANLTRLGRSTVTGIIALLAREGFVIEVGAGESKGGRRPVLLQFNANAKLVIAIKLEPGQVVACLTDLNAAILQKVARPLHRLRGPEAICGAIKEAIKILLEREAVGPEKILGIGLAMPGIVDQKTGTSISPTFFQWSNVPIRAILEEELGIPVYVENDANALALGERWYGAGRGRENLAVLTVGIGVGAGIIIGGQLYRGAMSGAGEIGHMTIEEEGPLCHCGNRGCLEAMASDGAIARRAREEMEGGKGSLILERPGGDPETITRETVVEAARAGNPVAGKILRDTGYHLGTGIANLVNILNPEVIVVGGEAAEQAGELLLEPVREAMRKRAFSVLAKDTQVVPAALGPDGWLIGAATLVLQEFFRLPIYRRGETAGEINIAQVAQTV